MSVVPEIFVSFSQSEPPIRCHSLAETEDVLDRLHEAELAKAGKEHWCPLHVSIEFIGNAISTGLGSAETFITIGSAPYDEWYTAVGDDKAVGADKMFYGVGQDSYWAPRHLIPQATAREAIRYFIAHQRLFPALRWEY